MTTELDKLFKAARKARRDDPSESKTAKLLDGGSHKIAKKLIEEAAEVSLAYMESDRDGMVQEAADLMYNLVVLLADSKISPDDVWAEMKRRRQSQGIAEKLPKANS